MSRLGGLDPSSLNDDQRALYDSITTGPRAQGPQHFALTDSDGRLLGPFNALLLSPGLGSALQEVGAAVRYRTGLTSREREIAILMVAAQWNSRFERDSHESVARAAGMTEAELQAIRDGSIPDLADERERACAYLAYGMTRGFVSDEDWATWSPVVGATTVFELTTLVGYYATLALQMRVFSVD
jgi:4-carboxymuconolactone decarboxylase